MSGRGVRREDRSRQEDRTCPICYELMAGKERQPTLLFPCGHTFCAREGETASRETRRREAEAVEQGTDV